MAEIDSSFPPYATDVVTGETLARVRTHVARASRPEILDGIGGFAGLFKLRLDPWREPVLASSTDGVGAKVAVAQEMGVHDTIGIDLVAMVVDDLVVCGAEPLFLQDYITVGKVVPEQITELVAGMSAGCIRAGCALLGGQTAERAGLLAVGDYQLSATAVGVVEADELLGPDRVRPGDVVVAMASSGLHTGGYSLARHVLLDIARMPLDGHVEEFGRTLGEQLLEPTRIYAKDCLALVAETEVRTFAHITDGGLAANLARVIPRGLVAVLHRGTWTPDAAFALIARRGRVPRAEMERTFNMGVGMVTVINPDEVDRAMAVLTARHVPAWVLGEVHKACDVGVDATDDGEQRTILRGDHPRF
ncbi:MAG: phosphoribosylformylglycinamidine cyclo-ligase [Pseudonocardiaceae bacterium]